MINKMKKNSQDEILEILFRQFSRIWIITSLSEEINLSRVGIWKVLKKLEKENLIFLVSIGTGKTNSKTIKLNWENPLLEKKLSLILTKEALEQQRWLKNFAELEKITDFTLLYGSILFSSKEANDIDILGVITNKKNFLKIDDAIQKIQKTQTKKIHSEIFTKEELNEEIKKSNEIFLDALKKGIILFGQEKFINFVKNLSIR